MGILDAASGKRVTYARGLEKGTAGLPQGTMTFLKYDAVDTARDAKWNKSSGITASEGEDKGTPGEIVLPGSVKYSLTSWQFAIDLAAMVGAPTISVLTASQSWLLQFFPNRNNAFRGLWEYLFLGTSTLGSRTAYGRRVSKLSLNADANKRIECTSTMTDGLGDTISGLVIPKTANAGTYAGKITSRGRRPNDATWTSLKSVFLKVTARTANLVTFVMKYDTASPGDGTAFPAAAYSVLTFTVAPQSNANNTDGFSTVIGDTTGGAVVAGPQGQFGEDYQPFQIALTLGVTDYSVFAVGDEFEIPAVATEVPFVNLVETRLSAFTMDLTLGGTRSAKFMKGTIELDRPYKPYKSNRSRYATAIDPSGNASLVAKLDERFFDNYFRDKQDSNARFQLYAKMQNDSVLPGTTADHEGVEIYAPQTAVAGLKEGNVASPDTLMHQATLNAENPDSAVAGPGSNFPGTRPWQCNITVGIDPTAFFGP